MHKYVTLAASCEQENTQDPFLQLNDGYDRVVRGQEGSYKGMKDGSHDWPHSQQHN